MHLVTRLIVRLRKSVAMSKKYKGKTCVYCADNVSITGDHVFAREFFLEHERDNLPQVPICDECNNKKSTLEHYLTSVLPFGGLHSHAKENLAKMVPKRLHKNRKLHKALKNGIAYIEVGDSKNMVIPIEGDFVTELFGYVAKGLAWYHWKTIIAKTRFVFSTALTNTGERLFNEYFFTLNAKKHITNTIGSNSFSYTGVQYVEDDQITIWLFKIYAGLAMLGGDNEKELINSIGVLTVPSHLEEKIVSIFTDHNTT